MDDDNTIYNSYDYGSLNTGSTITGTSNIVYQTIRAVGGGGGGGGGGGYTYASTSSDTFSIRVSPDHVVFPDGKNLTEKLGKLDEICERLSILEPNPALMEKYSALREAYEHYKTLEALLKEQPKNE